MTSTSSSPQPTRKLEQITQPPTVPPRIFQIRARLIQTYIALAVFIFVILAILARTVPYFSWDLRLARMIQSIRSVPVRLIMNWVSWIGYPPQAVFAIAGILTFLWFKGLRWESVTGLIGFTTSALLVNFFKEFIGRIRPGGDVIQITRIISSGSFPSGHVVSYTVIFGYFWFLTFALLERSPIRTTLLILFALLIVFVGPSRVYLGAHWPSDVFGAYLLGTVWLLVTITLYRWGKPMFFTTPPVP